LDDIAYGYGVGTDAIALRFVMDHLKPSLVLSGATTKQQLDANLKALSIQLSPEELASLKKFHIEAKAYWLERKHLSWN
jgi:aryl-alcohol dehydrogenase-like predicted oxidoreductase